LNFAWLISIIQLINLMYVVRMMGRMIWRMLKGWM